MIAWAICAVVFSMLLAVGLVWVSGPEQPDDFRNALRGKDDD